MRPTLRLIYTICPAGQEAAFQEWYRTVHLPHILSVEGFLSGQLFRLLGAGPPMQTDAGLVVAPYVAVYETNSLDAAVMMERLRTADLAARRRGFPGMRVVSRATYTPLTDRLPATWTT